MKLLDKYLKAGEDLGKYFEEEGFTWYGVCDYRSDYWKVEGDSVGWSVDKQNCIEEDRNYYEEEIITISRKKELTAILIKDWAGKSWNIFDSNKEIK